MTNFLAYLGQQSLDDIMLSDDKLLVVLGVVLIIWAGFVTYVVTIDRKIRRLEESADPQES